MREQRRDVHRGGSAWSDRREQSRERADGRDAKRLAARVVTPVFQDVKDGKARSLFLFVKRARGAMVRWMVEHRAERPEDLREATFDGYRLDPDASTEDRYVFRRPQPPPPGRG